jgi:hypothetical protein
MTEPSEGTFDFRLGDALVDYAVGYDMKGRNQ